MVPNLVTFIFVLLTKVEKVYYFCIYLTGINI